MQDRIQIRWIPAHIGVPGNEAADEAAREGTQLTGDAVCLAAAAKRQIRRRIKERWAKEWKANKGAKPTHQLVEVPNKKVLDLYKGLTKPHVSIIIQLRTQRNGLCHFLYKIKVSESDRCRCEEGSQTSRHVLQCPLYIEPRKAMLDKLDPGVRGKLDYKGIMSHPQAIRYVAEFMHQTGLLSQFREAELQIEQNGH